MGAHASRHERWRGLISAALLLIALIWSYRSTLAGLISDWRGDPNYSVGLVVPFAAACLLWSDRRCLAEVPLRPCWWGLVVILLAQGMRGYGLLWLYESAERYSLVLTTVGLVWLVGGSQLLLRTGWVLLFLLLMVPLPGRVHNLVSAPLQSLATQGAVFTLELLGIGVAREGHVLLLDGRVPVAVAEACSGLRMLTAFVVVSAFLAYVVRRPRWQKAVLLISSIPIAILCNLIRLVVTALMFHASYSELADRFFHDFAGLTMMPLAVVMLAGELWLFSRLVIPDGPSTKSSAV